MMTHRIRIIDINYVEPDCRCVYDSESVDEMIRSIRREGQIHPIEVWFAGRFFRILDGEKRWRAFKKMGIGEIKARIVEDLDEWIGNDPETNTLVRSGVESILNPYDLVALEQAVLLKEAYGREITAISMGPPQAESILRQSLSMGADRGVLLSDRAFAGADTLATSYTLFMAIKRIDAGYPVDLILCGKQAIDGDTAQTGPGIATRMKFTQLTDVSEVQWVDPDKREIQVLRNVEGGTEMIRGELPALLTVELDLAKPRRAGLPALIHSLKAPVAVWDAGDISAAKKMVGIKGSPTWVRKISSPPQKKGGPRSGRISIPGPASCR